MKFSGEQPQDNSPNEVEKQRKELPIDAYRDTLIEALKNNDVVILVGETGSGKTTRGPLFLLDAFPEEYIAVTSPRVLPARSVSKYVAKEIEERVGDTVGLITRDIHQVGEKTRCVFMTDGILLNMLREDPMLTDFDIIMLDEAHERGLNVDFALGLLRQAQELRKEQGHKQLKVVIASATLEEEKFSSYLNAAPIVKVPGRTFPVDVEYREPYLVENPRTRRMQEVDYTTHAAQVTKEILGMKDRDGDILIFMPGESEIRNTIEEITRFTRADPTIEVLPLFSGLSPEDQDKVFAKNGKRKVIVATNIAETSITIDTLRHVIDTGLVRESRYDPVSGISSLAVRTTAKANMEQRKGRAGRVSSGWCYRLMSRDSFAIAEPHTLPELLRSNLADTVLKMKDMGIRDVEHFRFIDQPSIASIKDAIKQLTLLGALDEKGDITPLGKEMAELPLRPDLSRTLLEARQEGCLATMVDIVAMLSSTKQVFLKPRHESDPDAYNKEQRQKSLKVEGSDYLTMLNVWRRWEEDGFSDRFAIDHLLNIKALDEAGTVGDIVLQALGDAHISVKAESALPEEELRKKITKCLLVARPDNIFYADDMLSNRWTVFSAASQDERRVRGASIFPGSSCFKMSQEPRFFIGDDVYVSDKNVTYIRRGHVISLEEIQAVAPHLVSETMKPARYGNDRVKETKINGVTVREEYISTPNSTQTNSFAREGGYFARALQQPVDVYRVGAIFLEEENSTLIDYNRRVIERLQSYYLRNRGIPNNFPTDPLEGVRQLLATRHFDSLDEVKNEIPHLKIDMSQYITKEQAEETERLSPKEIRIGEAVLPVYYSRENTFERGTPLTQRKATVQFNLSSVYGVLSQEKNGFTVDLPLVDEIVFSYSYYPENDLFRRNKFFSSFKELVHFAMTNSSEKRQREHQDVASGGMSEEEKKKFFAQPVEDQLRLIQGNLDTKEKKEVLATRVSYLKSLFAVIEGILSQREDSKTRNKIISQITARKKEIRALAELVEDYKRTTLKVDTVVDQIRTLEGRLRDRDLLTELGIYSEKYLEFVYHNIQEFEKSALDGDVSIDTNLRDRIVKKSLELLMSKKPVLLNGDQAGEILIGELI